MIWGMSYCRRLTNWWDRLAISIGAKSRCSCPLGVCYPMGPQGDPVPWPERRRVALFAGAAGLIVLHGMDGQIIYVNPDQVTNLRKPRSTDQGHFAKGINCLVFQADGKYFATLESCEDVRARLQEQVR